jgi:serine/threonine-protein kinase
MLQKGTVVGGLLIAALGCAANATDWRTYHNERFGTTATIPPGWTANPPPDNDDGLTFTSPDRKAKITISGILNTDEVSREFKLRLSPNPEETISYLRRGDNWLVVSGTRSDVIFYRKSLLSCNGTIWNDLSIEYPASQKVVFMRMVERIARSLKAGSGYQVEGCQ